MNWIRKYERKNHGVFSFLLNVSGRESLFVVSILFIPKSEWDVEKISVIDA